jgi:hypothetical protein
MIKNKIIINQENLDNLINEIFIKNQNLDMLNFIDDLY